MNDFKPCAVLGEQFPVEGKYLSINAGTADIRFEALCSRCRVWSTLPYRKSLRTVYLIGCNACGYGKRGIEEAK